MTSARRNLIARVAPRVGWGLADQGLSSLTNFVLGVFVARTLGLDGFGAFSLAFAAYLLVAGLSRAVNAQPLLVRYSGTSEDRWRRGARAATGSALLIGLVTAVVSIGVASLTTGRVSEAFLALAFVLPGLTVQDSWRFAFFAHGRGRSAFLTDLTWTLIQVPALFAAAAVGGGTVSWFVIAWGASATVAALIGVALSGVIPGPAQALGWYREHRDLLPPYTGEFAANQLAGQLFLYAAGAVAGLPVVGTIRAAQILVGPLYVVVQGSYLVAVPEAVRVARTSRRRLTQLCLIAAIGLASVGIGWGIVLEFLPHDVGRALIGDVWDPVHTILLPWAVAFGFTNVGIGALIGLRAMDAAAGRIFRASIVGNGAGFIGGVGGAALGGAVGATWGYLAAQVFGAAVWWFELRGALRSHEEGATPSAELVDPEVSLR